jgi:hypothetical protein
MAVKEKTLLLEDGSVKREKGNCLMKKAYAQKRTRSHISLQSGVDTSLTDKSRNQSDADRLNKIMTNYFSQEWSAAYEQNELPDTLSDFGKAVKTAFGTTVVPVTPTQERFNEFNGVYLPSNKNKVYINTKSNVGFINVVGHENINKAIVGEIKNGKVIPRENRGSERPARAGGRNLRNSGIQIFYHGTAGAPITATPDTQHADNTGEWRDRSNRAATEESA